MNWLIVQPLLALLLLPLVAREILRFSDLPTRFLLFAIWLRLVLGGMSQFTATPLAAGQSTLAFVALVLIALGVLIVYAYRVFDTAVWPFVLLASTLFVSTAANGIWAAADPLWPIRPLDVLMSAVEPLATIFYFLIIFLLLLNAMRQHGVDPLLRALLTIYALPALATLVAIAGGAVIVQPDGSTGYPAGYSHIATMSTLIFALLCIVALRSWRNLLIPMLVVPGLIVLIYLVGYRTQILGASAVFLGASISFFLGTKHRQAALLLALGLGLLAVGPVVYGVSQLGAQFGQIIVVAQNLDMLWRPPELLYEDERRLFSGRIFLWAQGIDAWLEAPLLQKFVGFGPEGYRALFDVSSHSGYIRYLVDMGLLGLGLFGGVLLLQFTLAARIQDPRVAMVAASGIVGFAIANVAAAPIASPEGLQTLAIVCATIAGWRAAPALSPDPTRIGGRWRSTSTT